MPDHFYVYPAYLGKGISRASGRRVPDAEGVSDLTAEEIVTAAKHLGFKAELESEKQYPRRFFEYTGRVKVTKKGGTSKAKFLHLLSAELRKRRTGRTAK